jgi:hypothetical protein
VNGDDHDYVIAAVTAWLQVLDQDFIAKGLDALVSSRISA